MVSFNPELVYGNLVQAHIPGRLVSESELYTVFSAHCFLELILV